MTEHASAAIVRYQGPPYLCVAHPCQQLAPWVLAADLGSDGEPFDGWSGNAWCDDHRPPCPYCNDEGVVHDMLGNVLGDCDCAAKPSSPEEHVVDLMAALEQSVAAAKAARLARDGGSKETQP